MVSMIEYYASSLPDLFIYFSDGEFAVGWLVGN